MGEFLKAWGNYRSDVEQQGREQRIHCHSRRSSASMSSSWLFLGELVSTRARLRFTNRNHFQASA
jgi:hypothetical protein